MCQMTGGIWYIYKHLICYTCPFYSSDSFLNVETKQAFKILFEKILTRFSAHLKRIKNYIQQNKGIIIDGTRKYAGP